MTALVLPTNRSLAERTLLTAWSAGWSPRLTASALAGVGLTGDETEAAAALHHLGILQGLRAGHTDARTVVDALPTVPYPEVLAGAIAEHEAHYRDAVDVLAQRAVAS